MNPLSEYIIPITGIKNGVHRFDYDVRNDFLAHFEYKELQNINVHAEVNFIKNNRLFDIEIHITGSVLTECDRCAEDLTIPIDFFHHLVVKLDDNATESEDEDIIFMPENTTEIDISSFVYEAIVFSVPMRRVHGNDKNGKSLCNEEALNRLNQYLIQDQPTTDPRWDALKKLLN